MSIKHFSIVGTGTEEAYGKCAVYMSCYVQN